MVNYWLKFTGFPKFKLRSLGWRLVLGVNSLMGDVFKSRYYPRSSFMEAKLGRLPSKLCMEKNVQRKGGSWHGC